jgi:putative membrane protein
MSLAAERTYLAYVRTSLALLAAGVAVVGVLPNAGHLPLRRATGLVLVVVGLLVAVTARSRWRQIDTAMRLGAPLPRSRAAFLLGVGVALAGALALALVLVI